MKKVVLNLLFFFYLIYILNLKEKVKIEKVY